ncbi:c-type cytochrome [Vibrio parahaemolyticus]|uniref:c-type cytochrome n=1 Tax=Vibrio parahaemolyticus TaxID=670 RepID=UPI0004214F84|nr:cytochrome c [Vibrio parahaemolyticus]EIZ9928853.1 cytochrome c [Vibrio parahaemolyticus]MDF5075088.1 cytochrome c [Vibrio parahaemolyticus]MDF5411785.1 cytochrome c [Vibrio parahaemolyticus]MDF5422046.1 cytochrome c [Vibrio parahaemolyticus]TOF24358.1 cytochrome C [Vibrio parahaemolyticus]
MKKTIFLLALLLPTFTWANDYSDVIEARQEAFSLIEDQLDSASDLIDGKDTKWQQLEHLAKQLTDASQTLSFPKGSHEGSKASEKIWQDPDKFQQLMAQMDQGISELYQASQQRDASMAEDSIDKAEKTCRSCHRAYRSR